MKSNICPGCDKPLINGQAMNGLLKCHWDCQDATRAKLGDDLADDLIDMRTKMRLAQDGIFPGHPLYDKLMNGVKQ